LEERGGISVELNLLKKRCAREASPLGGRRPSGSSSPSVVKSFTGLFDFAWWSYYTQQGFFSKKLFRKYSIK